VTGQRELHCEGMSRAHLPYLAKAGINYFQPSVSPLLTCEMLAEDLSIEYDWLLPTFELADMSDEQIVQWVNKTAAAGVRLIRTQAGCYLFQNHGAEKIYSFLKAFDNLEI
jgi:hypothetical protein